MSVETAIWKMSDHGPIPVAFESLELEAELEDLVVNDSTMLGSDLLIVGRQVVTTFGGFVDVLGLDSDAHLHVIELKRDRTPREVVAQVLDYGSWATGLTLGEVESIYAEHHEEGQLEDAFAERFSIPLPDVFNADQQLTIVAAALDPASDRIVEFLAERYGVPVNAVFCRYFQDGANRYLSRTWLLSPEEAAASTSRAKRGHGQVRPWNGRDFYVIQGTADAAHNDRWEIARKYGLLNAGGTSWYWKPLRNLAPGKRVFAYVGKVGYVGIGTVMGEMRPARDVTVQHNGQNLSLLDVPEVSDVFRDRAMSDRPETTEMVVPVKWDVAVTESEAISETGLFASQVTVCKLRDERTIELVEERFGLRTDNEEL